MHISIHPQSADLLRRSADPNWTKHTSKNIQKVSDREPKMPDAASRGVSGTGSSAALGLESHATGMVTQILVFNDGFLRKRDNRTGADCFGRYPGKLRCAVEDGGNSDKAENMERDGQRTTAMI